MSESRLISLLESRRPRRLLYGLIFVVLLFNAREYPIGDGYDYGGHRDYVRTLLYDRALPTQEITQVYYNAPTFYLFSAVFYWLSDNTILGEISPAKIVRMVLAVMACSSVWFAAQICGMALGEKSKNLFLLWIAAMPALFKVSAMFTPETFGMFFIWLGSWIGARSWHRNGALSRTAAAGTALCLCVAAWTRPLHAIAAAAWTVSVLWMLLRDRDRRRQWLTASLVGGAICLAAAIALIALNCYRFGHWIGMPEDMRQWHEIGENQTEAQAPGLASGWRNNPLDFYIGLSLTDLFRRPVRENLGRRMIPVFYSDWWGDYWKYWTCNEEDEDRNQALATRLLAIQNVAALPATFILIVGAGGLIFTVLRAPPPSIHARLAPLAWLLAIGAVAYFLFLSSVAYRSSGFDYVKASYIIFLDPAVAISGAWIVQTMFARRRRMAVALCAYLLIFAAWSFLVIGFYWHDLA